MNKIRRFGFLVTIRNFRRTTVLILNALLCSCSQKPKENFNFFARMIWAPLAFLPLIWLFVVKLLKTHSDKKCRSWSYLDQVLCHSRHAGAAAMPKWDADCQKINAKYALTKDYMSFKQAMDVLPLRNWVSFKAWPKITTAGFAQRHS